MTKKAEDGYSSTLSILSKGTTGSGKTVASCGKDFRPVYVFDTDQRMTSVINYYKRLDGHIKDVEYDSFSMGMSFSDLDKKMDWILKEQKYKTVVVATLTSYIHIVLAHLIQFKVGSKKGKSIGDIKVNSIEDYNAEDAALIFELVGFLMELKQRGTNVILEAHLTPIEYRDLEGNSRTVLETLTKGKKAPAAIPGYFDEVYYFQKKHEGIVVGQGDIKYRMSTSDSLVDCKSSRGVRNIEWTDADFSELLFRQINSQLEPVPLDPEPKKLLKF